MADPTGNTIEFATTEVTDRTMTGAKSNWIDCCMAVSKDDNNRGALMDSKYDQFNKACVEHNNNKAELLNAALANQGFMFHE